jgi:hypothetical protein
MQAITTKYLGPTNHKGARIKATCQAGSVTIGFPYADDDHAHACAALLAKLGWTGHWVSGGLPDGTGNAYVCLHTYSDAYVCLRTYSAKATINGKPLSAYGVRP